MNPSIPIPLQIQIPQQPSPLQTIAGLMQIRSSMTENALRAAQIQTAQAQQADIQAQADQRQRDLADQNTIQSLSTDPDTARQFGSGDFSALDGKVQPKTLQSIARAAAAPR